MDTATITPTGAVRKKTYTFTLALAGAPEPPATLSDEEWSDRMCDIMDEVAGKILAAGCDDSTLHSTGPRFFLDFHREADSLGDAIGSAVNAVEQAGYSVARVEVEGATDDLPG